MDDSDSSSNSTESSPSTPSPASQYASYGEGRKAAETAAGYGLGTSPDTYSGSGGRLYDSNGTVYQSDGTSYVDSSIVGTPPAGVMSGATTDIGAPSSAPVVSSETKLRGVLTGGRTVLSLQQMIAGGPFGFVSGLMSIIQQGLNGEFKSLGFGSAPPSTAVSAGSGASQTAAAFSGESFGGGYPRSSSSSSSFGSPVIGYQGALVNQGSPALATANLSTTPAAAKAQPAGVVIQTQQQDGFPWGGLLLAVGAAALLS